MRDFRDAKTMAHALRDALKGRAVDTTHGKSLELIAKAFGYENWNILAAKIEAAKPRPVDAPALSPAGAQSPSDPAAPRPLHCSFCGKSQHDVRKLIAGPAVFICDECVELCVDIAREEGKYEIFRLLKPDEESGDPAYPAGFELARGTSSEKLAEYVELGGKGLRCAQARFRRTTISWRCPSLLT
jgi:hypothetical protein